MNAKRSSGAIHFGSFILVTLLAVGLAGLLIWGFIEGRGEATAEAQSEKPVKAAVEVSQNANGNPTITLSPGLQKQADIETVRPKSAPYQRQVHAYGSILDLQPFTDLSNTIANAKAQRAIAEAKLSASRAALRRAQVLHKNGQNISTAQLQAAEATYQSDAASAQAAQVQTQNAAASAYQAWGPILGRSLVDGTALAGDLVQNRKVLVQVTLPLAVSLAQAPRQASIETATGQRVTIEFVSPATRTDPRIQGVSFYYAADAASGALPGMNVIAYLPVGQPAAGVAIPASAVVWLQGRAWVYLQTGPTSFTRREIPTSEPQPDGGYVVPVSGGPLPSRTTASTPAGDGPQAFPPDAHLVLTGAQTLLSQEFSAQIQIGDD